jgi:hypothetical protein
MAKVASKVAGASRSRPLQRRPASALLGPGGERLIEGRKTRLNSIQTRLMSTLWARAQSLIGLQFVSPTQDQSTQPNGNHYWQRIDPNKDQRDGALWIHMPIKRIQENEAEPGGINYGSDCEDNLTSSGRSSRSNHQGNKKWAQCERHKKECPDHRIRLGHQGNQSNEKNGRCYKKCR